MMKKYIWVPIALIVGIIDGVFARTLGISGPASSFLIIAVLGVFLTEEYSSAVVVAVFGGVIKALLTGREVGWFGLFSTVFIGLIGLIKYFVGIVDEWIDWVVGVILMLGLYFAELLIVRGFKLPDEALMSSLSVWRVVLWIGVNIVGILVFRQVSKAVNKWVNED